MTWVLVCGVLTSKVLGRAAQRVATARVLCNQLPSDQTLIAGRARGDEWTAGDEKRRERD